MKKRVMAIIVIVFLVLLYVTDLILAVSGSPEAKQFLLASLACTFIIPILLYGFFVLSGGQKRRLEEEMRRGAEEAVDEETAASGFREAAGSLTDSVGSGKTGEFDKIEESGEADR